VAARKNPLLPPPAHHGCFYRIPSRRCCGSGGGGIGDIPACLLDSCFSCALVQTPGTLSSMLLCEVSLRRQPAQLRARSWFLPDARSRSAYSSNLCCQSCRTLSLENSRANSYRGCRYRRFSVAPCVKGGHIRGFTGLMQSSERHSRPTILGVLAGMESEVVVGNIHGSGGLNSMDIAGNYFAVSARWGRELIGEGFSQPLASQKYGVADLCAWDICGIWRKQHSVADFCLLRQGWNVRVRKRARSCALSLWRSGARPSLAD